MVGVLRTGELELSVTPLDQHSVHPPPDFDENMACWYTAAIMVLSHRGPLQPLEMTNLASLARLWTNKGIQPGHLGRLADEAGLEHAPAKALFPRMGAAEWYAALSMLGPLIVIVPGHAVVVRGIVNQGGGWFVVVNDPWTGTSHREALLRFNGRVQWHLPMLYRRSPHRAPLVLAQPVIEPYRVRY